MHSNQEVILRGRVRGRCIGTLKLDGSCFFSFLLQDNGVDLLGICSLNPPKYTLALMDALFSIEKMATKCYIVLSKSTKSPLLSENKKLIEGKNKIKMLNDLINNFFVILDCANEKFGQGPMQFTLKYAVKQFKNA